MGEKCRQSSERSEQGVNASLSTEEDGKAGCDQMSLERPVGGTEALER